MVFFTINNIIFSKYLTTKICKHTHMEVKIPDSLCLWMNFINTILLLWLNIGNSWLFSLFDIQCLAQNGMEYGSDMKIIGNSYSLVILKIHLDFFNVFYSQCTCTLIVEYLMVKNTLNNWQFSDQYISYIQNNNLNKCWLFY